MQTFNQKGFTKRLLQILKDKQNECCDSVCPVLSGADGNIIECRDDGLFAQSIESTDVQVFELSDTWTKPAGAKSIEVHVIAAGSGGGSGRKGAVNTVRNGGTGGGAGGYSRMSFDASIISDTVAIQVGIGGVGGAPQTVNSTNGNPGLAGTLSAFGNYIRANGDQQGAGGTNGAQAGATGGTGLQSNGGNSGTPNTTGGNGNAPAAISYGPIGGASAGGVSSANVQGAGASGNTLQLFINNPALPSNAGAAGGGNGGNGNPFITAWLGYGGGSGGGNITGNGGNGGNGSLYGAGGGGGGAALDNVGNSGGGGNGAGGIVVVITYF